jgi:uncharacterized membrane protein YfcA
MNYIGDPTIFVFALFGGAIASWVMMRIKWLPDPPPPDIKGRYLTVLIVGIVAGVVGGYFGMAGSNLMPGLAMLGAGSASFVAAGGIAILSSAGRSGTDR